MARTDQNIDWHIGDDKLLTFTIVDEDNEAVNLTGLVSAQWVLKRYPESTGTPSIEKTLGSGITVYDATGGILQVTVNSADTLSLTAGQYYHELRIKNSDSKLGTVTTGIVNLLPTDPL
jgi:hypothetical protein